MIKLVLRFFDAFHWLIQLLGADYPQFRAILETKLTLDGRRQMTGFQNQKHKESGNAFVGAMFLYSLFGFFMGFVIFHASILVSLTVVHSMVMTFMAMTLIADFSSVLLDTTDNAILQPRPISGRTILLARIAHVLIYLGLLGLSLSLVALVAGTIKIHFLFPIVFLGTLICSMVLVVCLANLFYLVALRLTDPEKVRDIILYFQIAMSVGVFAGYQVLPRLIDMTQLQKVNIEHAWWIYIFPPAWMAAPIDLLFGHAGKPQLLLTLEAVLIPAVSLWFVVRVLAPRFTRSLAELEAGSSQTKPIAPTSTRRRSLASLLSRWVSKNPVTRAAFELVWKLCARDRQFKLRTYPTIAFVFVFPIPVLMAGGGHFWDTIRELHNTQKHIFALYMSSLFLVPTILQIRYSDKWQAAWIYESLPIRRPGEILAGAFLAVALRFLMPAFLLIATILLMIWGLAILPDIVLAFCVIFLIGTVQAIMFGTKLPFSEAFGVVEGSGRIGKSMLYMLMPPVLGGLHYLLTFQRGAVTLAIPIVFLITIFFIRRYAATTWTALAD